MKRFAMILLSLMLIFSTLFAIADAEEFAIRGTRFGMTPAEVKAIESLPYSSKNVGNDGKETYSFEGTISGIDNSRIYYIFEKGVLKSINIDFDNTKGKILLERDYNTINSALKSKYGIPLGLAGGKTYEFVGQNLEAMAMTFPLAELVNMSYDYCEWWIETDGGHVKIDQIYSFIPGKKGSEGTAVNSIQYTFFSESEINSVLGDL